MCANVPFDNTEGHDHECRQRQVSVSSPSNTDPLWQSLLLKFSPVSLSEDTSTPGFKRLSLLQMKCWVGQVKVPFEVRLPLRGLMSLSMRLARQNTKHPWEDLTSFTTCPFESSLTGRVTVCFLQQITWRRTSTQEGDHQHTATRKSACLVSHHGQFDVVANARQDTRVPPVPLQDQCPSQNRLLQFLVPSKLAGSKLFRKFVCRYFLQYALGFLTFAWNVLPLKWKGFCGKPFARVPF